jgi:hypothetical protein
MLLDKKNASTTQEGGYFDNISAQHDKKPCVSSSASSQILDSHDGGCPQQIWDAQNPSPRDVHETRNVDDAGNENEIDEMNVSLESETKRMKTHISISVPLEPEIQHVETDLGKKNASTTQEGDECESRI